MLINIVIKKLDKAPLWAIGLFVLSLTFIPYILMGEGSVFDIHDQLDETICSYVLTARHMFDGTGFLPEVMGGISNDGMLPSAVLFVLFYRLFPMYTAFLLHYFIVSAVAFLGMYGLLKKLTGSSGIAVVTGVLFVLLPFKPVYGLSVMGVPLLCLCFILLYERRHVCLSLLGIVFFGLTTHLVLIGYVVLTYLGIVAIYLMWKRWNRKKELIWFLAGICLLIAVYCIINFDMFVQLVLGTSDFVSHREEFINNTDNINTVQNILNIFLYGESAYAPSYHWYILPVLVMITLIQGIRFRKLSVSGQRMWKILTGMWLIVIVNALLYGFLTSAAVMEWRNQQTGFFRYFQANRYYWAYPSIWWIMIGIGLALVWLELPKLAEWLKICVLVLLMLPTMNLIKDACNLYDNLNQYNHGSAYTGKPTWQEHYMQDVMERVDQYIGRDKSEFRIAHVGLNPTAALVYGFYTVDGYSNNYSLEYKHAFRRIIEKELEKNEALRIYYDTWGSRCYLYSAEGDQPLKSAGHVYQNLEFDLEQLKALGCEYIFSAGEIIGKMDGIALEGVFETDESIYELWLYRIN